jgi:Toxin with a conserved tryptophan and TIP tripeptide motif
MKLPRPLAAASDVLPRAVKTAVGVGAGIGVGYIIYRGLRLLPSLFPALWPTLPANLAIP